MTEAAALLAVRRLLDAIRSGERPDLGTNRYYALTLSGAAGRVMVRDWMEGGFEDLVANIERWFADLSIIARDGHNLAPNPKFMAVCGRTGAGTQRPARPHRRHPLARRHSPAYPSPSP